jgi:hypothetical protein
MADPTVDACRATEPADAQVTSEKELRQLQRENSSRLLQKLDSQNKQISSLLSSLKSKREEAMQNRESQNREPAPVPVEILPASHEDWAGLCRRAAQPDGHEARVTLEIQQRLVEVEQQLTRTAVAAAPASAPDATREAVLKTFNDAISAALRHPDGLAVDEIQWRALLAVLQTYGGWSVPAAEEVQS